MEVLNYFDQHAKVLGVTATPDRGDKRNLGAYFEEIAYEVGLARLVNEGYLSRIIVKKLPINLDLRSVGKVAGDYNMGELGHALSPRLSHVAEAITRETRDRKTIVFLPLVQMAQDFAFMLAQLGVHSRAVAGVDSPETRHSTLNWFAKAGKGSVLCNAMLLTEGFDQPDVDCIVCLRPTQVRSLFAQMVGRGTRIHPGKENLLLLDFLWQTDEHKLITISKLVASAPADVAALETAVEEGKELFEAAQDVETQRLNTLIKKLDHNKERPPHTYDAVEMALALDDDDLLQYEPTMEWHEKDVSPAQVACLIKSGFDPGSVTCRGHAAKILDKIAIRRSANLATPKQVRIIKRFGHKAPDKLTFAEASAIITRRFGK
jgi:superfamily II DNA or RNA helicase